MVPKNLFSLYWVRVMKSKMRGPSNGALVLVVWLEFRQVLALHSVISLVSVSLLACPLLD
eukprot:scaffold90794_cov23-Cyclotella_meneghiniana.AAC.1